MPISDQIRTKHVLITSNAGALSATIRMYSRIDDVFDATCVFRADGWGTEGQVLNTRDAHGRFLKGTTGNPKGRPTKLSMIESADFQLFRGTMVEVDSVRGRKRILTREGAIQERLYASAMKGNVQAQIFLTRKFDEFTVKQAESADLLHKIYKTLLAEKRLPTDDESDAIRMLRMVLGHDPRPDWKYKKARPSRAKRNTTAASDGPPSPQQQSNSENASRASPPAKPAKPSK